MKLCRDYDLPSYASAVALLAIHSAIAFNDAVLIKLAGKRPMGEDHRSASQATIKNCKKWKINDAGVRHLTTLIGRKTDIAYGDKAVEQELAMAMPVAAERFEAWASGVLRAEEGRV